MGFWVIVDNEYFGPFARLNEAREEARKNGKDIPIFHGEIKKKDDGTIDSSLLFLIPKSKNGV